MSEPFRFWGADLLTVPVVNARGRQVWISQRQYRVMVRLFDGRRFNQRLLAADLGYSIGGFNDALRSLVTLGLIVKRTTLGRLGSTFAKVRAGCHVGNVREQGYDVLSNEVKSSSLFANIYGTISPNASTEVAG